MNAQEYFANLIAAQKAGVPEAICSICSSNLLVLEAAMEEYRDNGKVLLIEATANQVNQFGGYTGMQAEDFIKLARGMAQRIGLSAERLLVGGDHLGPLTWCEEKEETAMVKAEELIRSFASAGFQKIHLDTSMRLADDPTDGRLPDAVIAGRAARLCAIAEANADPAALPVYIIGSEVPVPGGAQENEDSLAVTRVQDLHDTLAAFRAAFAARGLAQAWQRVVGIVVQPGVEFADNTVIQYAPEKAAALVAYAKGLSGLVLEGHSTDYQPAFALSQMKQDGIAILKVGPALTFALREALFAMEEMERLLYTVEPAAGFSHFAAVLDSTMCAAPKYWDKYYQGSEAERTFARKFSLSDRSRYYFDQEAVQAAIARLFANLNAKSLPLGLLSQYFPLEKEYCQAEGSALRAENLAKEHVKQVIRSYNA